MNKLRTMNPEQAAALFRTLMQVLGAIVGTAGFLTETQWAAISGPLGTLVFLGWGIYARRDVALLESAAKVPGVQAVVAEQHVALATPDPKVTTPSAARGAGMLAVLLCLTPLLGACTMTPASVGTPSAAVVTKADVAVARASAEVVKYCGYVRAALSIGGLFASREITVRAIDYAEEAVAAYCDNPPSDVVTALGVLQRAYTNVVAAQRS